MCRPCFVPQAEAAELLVGFHHPLGAAGSAPPGAQGDAGEAGPPSRATASAGGRPAAGAAAVAAPAAPSEPAAAVPRPLPTGAPSPAPALSTHSQSRSLQSRRSKLSAGPGGSRAAGAPGASGVFAIPRGKAAKAAQADATLHPVLRMGWQPLCSVVCNGLTGDFLGGHGGYLFRDGMASKHRSPDGKQAQEPSPACPRMCMHTLATFVRSSKHTIRFVWHLCMCEAWSAEPKQSLHAALRAVAKAAPSSLLTPSPHQPCRVGPLRALHCAPVRSAAPD